MFAPGVMDIMIEFKATSTTLASFCVSVYVLGFAAGPLIFAPLSEIYGRTIIYHGTNVCFCGMLGFDMVESFVVS
jgi:MFS family permease